MVDVDVRERRVPAMLALVSAGYFLSVWAWGLLGPLAPRLRHEAGLTGVEQALIVAVPVLVGCLGRAPVGALADRFGGRIVVLAVTGLAAAALTGLAAGGYRSLPGLLIGGALLGCAGTMFAAGVQLVSRWFPGAGRGVAMGVLGMGVCGSAAGGLTAVRWADAHGIAFPFLISAALLVAGAVVIGAGVRDAPGGPARPAPGRLAAALRLPITWRAGAWYSVQFGLFVAFSVYLPVYLGDAYGLDAARAGLWMAGVVVLAMLARPLGGWLADRVGAARPLAAGLAALAAAATVQAFTPPLAIVGGLTLPVMAIALGVASSATLVRVAGAAGAAMVGLVTGLVTAAAGLAGFATPLIMAFSYSATGGHGPAVAVLAAAAGVAAWSAR
ncbi:nitrate/nitrite transporter [Actinoplanes sp. NPDC000266]